MDTPVGEKPGAELRDYLAVGAAMALYLILV
jgi:hypothetical protein